MKKIGKIIIFSLLLALIPFHSFASASTDSEMSEAADTTLAEGKVKRYNQETQTILLQLKSGQKIKIILDWNTKLVGYSSPDEIEKGHKVKVWYSQDSEKAVAIKIEKKLEVGC